LVPLEIYPAPIELLNKLLSLLGDPEYIEVGAVKFIRVFWGCLLLRAATYSSKPA
jgi:hypothetical protein